MILRTVLGSVAFVGLLILNNCAAEGPAPARTSSAVAAAPSLDGHAYEVKLVMPGQPEEIDGLVFVDGRFESTACTKFGFPRFTEYQSQRSGDGVAFNVTTKNPSGAKVEWQGVVRNGKISGTAKLTMNGEVTNGSFEGTDTHKEAMTAKR